MKIYQIEVYGGDSYEGVGWIGGSFLSKKSAFMRVWATIRKQHADKRVDHYKDSEGRLVWMVDEDDYSYTTYKINEVEVDE